MHKYSIKMKKHIFKRGGWLFALALSVGSSAMLTSCNDWLDVRPDTEQKEDGQFGTEKGFQTALTGCYIQMASTSAYGMQLSMTSVECLANLWYVHPSSKRYAERDLSNHNYTSDYSKSAMSSIYTALFKTIAQANLIIKNAEENPGVFTEKRIYNIVLGEAYAIRAYCQLDILRLFGQMPQNGSRQVKLPYSETTSIYDMPAYYSFADYAAKLKSDITQAEQLLRRTATLPCTIPYNRTYATDEVYEQNTFLMYRQMRLNYWAVRALHARMALYTGDKQEALRVARELIKAQLPDGTPGAPPQRSERLQGRATWHVPTSVTSASASTTSGAISMATSPTMSSASSAPTHRDTSSPSATRCWLSSSRARTSTATTATPTCGTRG